MLINSSKFSFSESIQEISTQANSYIQNPTKNNFKNILDTYGILKGSMIMVCVFKRMVTAMVTHNTSILKYSKKTNDQTSPQSNDNSIPSEFQTDSSKASSSTIGTEIPVEQKPSNQREKAFLEKLKAKQTNLKTSVDNDSNLVKSQSKPPMGTPLPPLSQKQKTPTDEKIPAIQEKMTKPISRPSPQTIDPQKFQQELQEKVAARAQRNNETGPSVNSEEKKPTKATTTYATAEPSVEQTKIETEKAVEPKEQKPINEGLTILKDKGVNSFINWNKDKKHSDAFTELKERIYLEGTAPQTGNSISLSAEDILTLGKSLNYIKETPAYGLALLKFGKKQEFKNWNKDKKHSDAFTELKERIYLEGTAPQTGNSISLSAEDILTLGKSLNYIKETPAYGLALLKLDEKQEFENWAILHKKDSDAFTELKERICLKGMSHYSTNGICVEPDIILSFGKTDSTAYKTAKILKDNRIPLDALKQREYSQISGSTNDKDICVPADVHAALHIQANGLSLEAAKKLVDMTKGEKYIGHGSFGNVYKVQDGETTYAVKIAKDTSQKNAFLQEKQMLDHLHSHLSEEERKYFVNHLGGFEIDGQFVFISEFISHTDNEGNSASDLDAIVNNLDNYTIQQKLDLVQGCFKRNAIGQKYGILYRDEKPVNIMVDGNSNDGLQAKGADYGAACFFWDSDNVETKGIGSPSHMAPEVLNKKDGASCALTRDVYSMGITFIEVLFGEAFPKKNFRFPWQIAECVTNGVWNFGEPPDFNNIKNIPNINDDTIKALKNKLNSQAEAKLKFLACLAADCTAMESKNRISAEQAEFLMRKFNEWNGQQTATDYDYEKLKKDPSYPQKGIPEAVMNLIKAGDNNARQFFENLITEDPSYIDTSTGQEALKTIGLDYFKNNKNYPQIENAIK